MVRYQNQQTVIVNVTFTIDLTPPQLSVSPGFLRFVAITGATTAPQQALLVTNLGTGGPINFTSTVVGSGSLWLSVTPGTGVTALSTSVPLQVTVNPAGLKIGSYLGKIRVQGTTGGTVDVPVSLFVSPNGPLIAVNPVGVRFDARAGNGLASTNSIAISNIGTGTVNWTADLQAGQNWLSLSPASGQAALESRASSWGTSNPQGLTAGAYYALIRITDPNALNSPQYAVAVLNVQAANAMADAELSPGGLYFTTSAGGTAPAAQSLNVNVSSDAPAGFQAAASSDDGASWLSIDKLGGAASTSSPGQIDVSVNPAGLTPGVYTGDVSVSFSNQTIRTANITFVVLPQGTVAASSTGKERTATCAPSRLSVTSTVLENAFSSPVGWPTPLSVRVTDDCGSAAPNAQVVASFSNGDPPLSLSLVDPTAAQFSGT